MSNATDRCPHAIRALCGDELEYSQIWFTPHICRLDPDASDPEAEMTEMEKNKKWIDADCPEPVRRTIMARQEKVRDDCACAYALYIHTFM